MNHWIFILIAVHLDSAYSVEVHFENKDGGFFLKHTPRQYYPTRLDSGIGSIPSVDGIATASSSSSSAPSESILSVDKFTVFQTSDPASVRATYGPFSTKQTVPARYIVPDPLETLPRVEIRRNITASNAALMDAQDLSTRHLDMSAHLVSTSIARDAPVLRVLFHAGSEAGGRRHLLLARHQRVCVLLHATLPGKPPLTAACSPDGEDGVCLAQITVPAEWWPPLPPPDVTGHIKVTKTPPKLVQVAYSVLEPRTVVIVDENSDGFVASSRSQVQNDGTARGCRPRVQIQPVTPLGKVPLVPNRSDYKELKADETLTLLIPHAPLYPRSRLYVPAFLHPPIAQQPIVSGDNVREVIAGPSVVAIVVRARVKSGMRILDATSSSANWILISDINAKNTAATFTVRRKDNAFRSSNTTAEEVMTMLLEASEEGGAGTSNWDGGRIMWSVRYIREGDEDDIGVQSASLETMQFQRQQQQHYHHHHHVEKRKLQARLEIHKDDIQAVLPISKNWEVINTAVLTGRQVSQAMKVFIVSQAGTVADVTLQSSCHSEDESVLKVSSSCSSVYVDGSEIRGSSNASVLVKYGTYIGLARFTVWMPEFPLEVTVSDSRLSQIKGWKVPDGHPMQKNKRSLNRTAERAITKKRSVTGIDEDDDEEIGGIETERLRGDDRWDSVNWIDRNSLQTTCRLRFQQSPVEVHARFLAAGHDSGRESYFVNRRTWLRVTDLVIGLLRVSDPRIAILLQDRIIQGRGVGRTEVQVLSPITGRVIGAKEIRVGNDRVWITHLSVKVVSGLQLSISPDTAIENGYVAETSVTRRLTAQYQEGLLDIDIEFSDSTRTPLREISVTDYHLVVNSLAPEVVAFAPMAASHHPRVIAVGEGRGDLLRITLQLSEACSMPQIGNKRSKSASRTNNSGGSPNLASATAHIEVDFASSDLPHRPEFVQNDGGGGIVQGSSHHRREGKTGQEVAPDLHDILIGGVGGLGIHHHIEQAMTPLQIGMYVLLAAFCFAIVVFVFSCVVYANKFKLSPSGSPIQSNHPMLGAMRARAVAASQQLSSSRNRPRESTTNAHDWVWLGRATLERAACAPQKMRLTNNPLAGEIEDDIGAEFITSFDNPNHIELPTTSHPISVPIDTTTYRKGDKPCSFTSSASKLVKNQVIVKSTAVTGSPRNGNECVEDAPPPLPPHGVVACGSNDTTNNNDDYKPPVPPHRNTGVNSRLSEIPKKNLHGASSGSHHGNHRHMKQHHYHHSKDHDKCNRTEKTTVDNYEEIVKLRNHEERPNKETKATREIKRATIVGNPMFSSSSSSSQGESEEPVALEDLNLGMDYSQIMEYFDNLKESNA